MFGWFLVTFGFLTTLSSALLHSGKPCNFNQTDNLHRRLTYLGVVFGCVLRTGPFSIFILKFYVPFAVLSFFWLIKKFIRIALKVTIKVKFKVEIDNLTHLLTPVRIDALKRAVNLTEIPHKPQTDIEPIPARQTVCFSETVLRVTRILTQGPRNGFWHRDARRSAAHWAQPSRYLV